MNGDTSSSGRQTTLKNMYVNKWYSFVAAILLQLMGGLCYCFSLYSSSLKKALDVDQPSLEFIASCLLSGGYFSWIPGETPSACHMSCMTCWHFYQFFEDSTDCSEWAITGHVYAGLAYDALRLRHRFAPRYAQQLYLDQPEGCETLFVLALLH